MKNFQYVKASSPATAVESLVKDANARFIAGGTNLVDLMKKGVTAPDRLVDITGLELKAITRGKSSIKIGALALNSVVAQDKMVMQYHPLLSQALNAGASQQIRNMATVGGNMLQRTRCPYFYNIDMLCNKREPGSGCDAVKGFNRMHAIFGASSSCIAVHPSDMCIALAALDATVTVTGPKGERTVKFTDFHTLPGDTPEIDTVLGKNELITSIEVPDNNFSKNVHYLKVRDRSSYAFALISVAVALEISGGVIKEARLAMGGVAHKPWRLTESENYLRGKAPSEAIFKEAAKIAMQGAKGYGDNNFKLKLAPNSITEALKIAAAKA